MFKPTTGHYYRNKSKADSEWFRNPKNKDHPLVVEHNRVIHNKWIMCFNRDYYLKAQPYAKQIENDDERNKFISKKMDLFFEGFKNTLCEFIDKQQCGCSKGYFNGSNLDYLINHVFMFQSSLEKYIDINEVKSVKALNLEKDYWNFPYLSGLFTSVDPAFQYKGKLDHRLNHLGLHKEIELLANILNIPEENFQFKIFNNSATLGFKFKLNNNLIKYILKNINLDSIKSHFNKTYNEFNIDFYKVEYLNNTDFFYENGKKIFRGNKITRRLNDALIYGPDNFYFYDSNNEWNEDITRDLVQLPNS